MGSDSTLVSSKDFFTHKKGECVNRCPPLIKYVEKPDYFIWLKLTSVRNDKKYFEKAGIGKLEWCLHFGLYKENQIC